MMKAVVSGHSRGLGAAIAAELLGRGIPVLGLARTGNAALAARFGAHLQEVGIDLADSAQLARWLAGATLGAWLADCDCALLVNDAGTLQPMGALDLQQAEAVGRAVALNVAAPMMLAAALCAASPATAERRVLHVSSGAARKPYPGWSVYCATKAALDHHARAVVADASPRLRICSLAPGVIDTGMQAEIRATPLERFPLRDRFAEMQRSGGLARAQDCAAAAVAHLLDDAFGSEPVADLRELAR